MVTSSPIQITVSWPTGYTSGQPSYLNVCHELWGDGIRVGSEKWDDGNVVNNDGCQADCTISTGFVWAGGTIVVKDTCVYWTTGLYPNAAQTQWIPHWADSRRAGSEACDDGNLVDGDGWSSTWTIESGYSWSGGSVTSKDTWAKWDPGYIQDTLNPTTWITVWGDGLRAGSEKWDDANTSSGDGWKGDWSTVESGWVCSGGSTISRDKWTKWDKGYYQNDASNPTTCVTKWGDGIRAGGEHWDDGNTVSKDGWSSDWSAIEEGFAWFGGYFGVVDVWVEWDPGYDPSPDFSVWIGSEVPRDVGSLATAVQAAAYVGCAVNLLITVFSSSSSTSSRSFGMINQIQLVIILPLIGAYIPEKIYDYLKSMNASLFNLSFLPTSNSGSTINFKSLFTYKQPNSYLYLLQLNSGSAFVNILDLTTTVGFVIAIHILVLIVFAILTKINKYRRLKDISLKILKMLTFGFYIGVLLETSILFLLVDFSEIHYQNKNGIQNTSSTVMSYIIASFILMFLMLAIWQWWKSRKPEVFETQKYFVTLVEGFKASWICRTYYPVFLIRRLLFIAIIFFMNDSEMMLKVSLFVVIQALYFLYILILRPQDSHKENLIDFINEIFYLYFVVFLLYFNTENRWGDTTTNAYFWILMANNFILIFITIVSTIRTIVIMIRRLWNKFKVKPKIKEESTRMELNLVNQNIFNYNENNRNGIVEEENKECVSRDQLESNINKQDTLAQEAKQTENINKKIDNNSLVVEDLNEGII